MTSDRLIFALRNQGITLEPKLKFATTSPLTQEQAALLEQHRDDLLIHLVNKRAVPRLPFELERLVSAASDRLLDTPIKGVTNTNDYVMGWACAYLVSDRQEALKQLQFVQAQKKEFESTKLGQSGVKA